MVIWIEERKHKNKHCRAPIPTRDTVFVFLYYHILKHTSERSFPFISHKIRISKRNFKEDFAKFKERVSKKRRKEDTTSKSDMEYITVQRLSSHVEGRYQKYARIGQLASVPLGRKPTIQNIKEACKRYFNVEDGSSCDVLAGERGPSWTETSQINNWKVIHIRFIEGSDDSQLRDEKPIDISSSQRWKSQGAPTKTAPSKSTKVAASVPLSAMLKLGKIIQPTEEIVTLQLEEFKINEKAWAQPFEVTLSLAKEKFASGGVRDAYTATPLSGLSPGKYVLKKVQEQKVDEIEKLFKSIEEHTRKAVQMNALVRNFSLTLSSEAPVEYGQVLSYTKVYFGKLYGEFVTLEDYLEGEFQKYVNNTGEIFGKSELTLKGESFCHYTYERSGQQLIVLDIQGVDHSLFDPEVASSTLIDSSDKTILFCCGNLSTDAIDRFKEEHVCNKFCHMLKLNEM